MNENETEEMNDGKMNWPAAVVNVVLILAVVAIVFIICGNDILKGWLT